MSSLRAEMLQSVWVLSNCQVCKDWAFCRSLWVSEQPTHGGMYHFLITLNFLFFIWILHGVSFLSPDKFSLMETDLDIDTPKNSASFAFTSASQAEYRILHQRGRCINTSLIMLNDVVASLPKSAFSDAWNIAAFINFAELFLELQKHQNIHFLIINSTHLSAPFHR